MDTNITFRIDNQVKTDMAKICEQLGMTPSAAFNIFANAFVRAKGMPFPVRIDDAYPLSPSKSEMMKDADMFLNAFAEDYRRMAQ